jgi:hypothetical protein
MSSRNIFCGGKGGWCQLYVPIVSKSGSLNLLDLSGLEIGLYKEWFTPPPPPPPQIMFLALYDLNSYNMVYSRSF